MVQSLYATVLVTVCCFSRLLENIGGAILFILPPVLIKGMSSTAPSFVSCSHLSFFFHLRSLLIISEALHPVRPALTQLFSLRQMCARLADTSVTATPSARASRGSTAAPARGAGRATAATVKVRIIFMTLVTSPSRSWPLTLIQAPAQRRKLVTRFHFRFFFSFSI